MKDVSDQLVRHLEAFLFAKGTLVPKEELRAIIEQEKILDESLRALEKHYAHRGVNLICVNDCWGFRTAPDCAKVLEPFKEKAVRLSQSALEILVICAYHQPISRAEIEAIRGVSVSASIMGKLMSLGWVKPQGRREIPGRPLLWGTTQVFLEHFGLHSLDDLPSKDEILALNMERQHKKAAQQKNGTLFTAEDKA